MTDGNFELSRRKVLGGLSAIGLASAGAGLGTSAYFSDTEAFENNALVAGELDMKVGYSAHYSDWSPDEGEGVDVRMWEGPAGTTGGQDDLEAGETGLPSNAAWLVAVDDPDQFLENTQYSDPELDGASCDGGRDAADLEEPVIELDDVKPGDFGEVTFDLALCDNPGYVWLQVDKGFAHENGYTEPEMKDPDESGPVTGPEGGQIDVDVELLDAVQAAYWVDDGDNYQDGDEDPAAVGSLREIVRELASLEGALPGDITASEGGGTGDQGCFSAGEHSVVFAWWVPIDHGNEIQTDSVEFDLSFYTEQCRHNDGSLDGLGAFLNADAELKPSPVWDGTVADRTGQDEVVVENNALTTVDIPEFPFDELPVAFDPLAVRVSTGTTVRWTWVTYETEDPDDFPPLFNQIPHNVVSLDGSFNSGAPVPAIDPQTGDEADDFTHTFSSPGTYLYYCTPHGAPFFVGSFEGGEVLNEFGMRGAVIVED